MTFPFHTNIILVANFLSVNGLWSRPNRPSAAATSVSHRSLEDLSRCAKEVCREVRSFGTCECPWYHKPNIETEPKWTKERGPSRRWCQVLMGDLNTGYYQPSQQLLRNGQMEAFGRHWQLPMTFTDAWAELHPGNPDPSTINNDPVRLDARGSNFAQPFCIFLQKVKGQRTSTQWINTCLQDFAVCMCFSFFSLPTWPGLIRVISSFVSSVTCSHLHCVLLQGLCLFPEDTTFSGSVHCPVADLATGCWQRSSCSFWWCGSQPLKPLASKNQVQHMCKIILDHKRGNLQ